MSFEPFITTFTGRKVNPLNLRAEDVCVEDVQHHLSLLNRFVGALAEPLSIAQHAVFVSELLGGTGFELHGLHHDDSEAYLGDVSKWVKQNPAMLAYRQAEEVAQTACDLHFGVVWTPEAEVAVEWADRMAVRYEAQFGFRYGCHMFDLPKYEKLEGKDLMMCQLAAGGHNYLEFMPWYVAKAKYQKRHLQLVARQEIATI